MLLEFLVNETIFQILRQIFSFVLQIPLTIFDIRETNTKASSKEGLVNISPKFLQSELPEAEETSLVISQFIFMITIET